MPRGGARPGAGRKPKDRATAKLHGSQRTGVVRFPGVPAPAAAVRTVAVEVPCPADLESDAQAVWAQLAPHALAAGTLTAGTAAAFALLCRAVVLEQKLAASELMAASPSHRGMMQRVEAGYVRFALAPMGKPIAQPVKDEDPFARFDEAFG